MATRLSQSGRNKTTTRSGAYLSSLVYALSCVLCICLSQIVPPQTYLLQGGSIALACTWCVAIMEARSTKFRINPIVTYQAWLGLTLGVGPIGIALLTDRIGSFRLGEMLVSGEYAVQGHLIQLVGSFFFYCGMKIFQPKESLRNKIKEPMSGEALIVVFLVSLLCTVFRSEMSRVFGSALINFISEMGIAGVSLWVLRQEVGGGRSKTIVRWVISLATVGLVVAAMSGDSKMNVMFAFFPFMWWMVFTGRRWWSYIYIAAGMAVLYVFIVSPLIMRLRYNDAFIAAGEKRAWNAAALSEVLPGVVDDVINRPRSVLDEWGQATVRRFSDFIATGAVATFVDEEGLLLGNDAAYVFVNAVPRFVWPDKPIINRGLRFTVKIGSAPSADLTQTSTGETVAGEWYWNWGWVGVVIGMFTLGSALSGWWWGASGGDPTSGLAAMTAFTGAALSFVMGTGSSAGPMLVGCASMGILGRGLRAIEEGRRLPFRRPGGAGGKWMGRCRREGLGEVLPKSPTGRHPN